MRNATELLRRINPERVVIDFSDLDERQVEAKAKQLRVLAEARGWRHRAEVGS